MRCVSPGAASLNSPIVRSKSRVPSVIYGLGSGLCFCCFVFVDQSADGRVVQIEMSRDFNLAVAVLVNRIGDQLIALGSPFYGLVKEPFQSRSSEKPLLLGDLFDHVFPNHMIGKGFGKAFGPQNALSLYIFPDRWRICRFSDIFPVLLLRKTSLRRKMVQDLVRLKPIWDRSLSYRCSITAPLPFSRILYGLSPYRI